MSGPIVRKYGFPNFEKIFGKESMKHGADEAETTTPSAEPTDLADADSSSEEKAKPVSRSKKSKK